eukprot:g3821.t1
MNTKQNAKTELQKFKTLTENITVTKTSYNFVTYVPAFRFGIDVFRSSGIRQTVPSSIRSFCELHALDLCPLISAFQTTHVKAVSQRVLEEVKKLTEFVNGKLMEFNKAFNEKAKTKKDANFDEFVNLMNCTSVEIEGAIRKLMQIHAHQIDRLIRRSADQPDPMIRQIESERIISSKNSIAFDSTSKFGSSRNCISTMKRDAIYDETHVDLDWDAFDRDLAAMTDAVGQMTSIDKESTMDRSNEVNELKIEIKRLQSENSELIRKSAVSDRSHQDTKKLDELRQELDQERVCRLEVEQKLRDAEEETKAAKFAYNVAKAVANKMAIDSNEDGSSSDTIELIDRSDSAYDRPNTASFQSTNAAIEVSHHVVSKDTYLPVVKSNDEDSNPFLETSHHDINPFTTMSDNATVDATNPFMITSHQGAVVGDTTNAFNQTSDESTNPFLLPKCDDVAANWNPFSSSVSHITTTTNPFLT